MSRNKTSSTARPIAAEDIRTGMYIAVLHVVNYGCRFCWETEPELMAARGPRLVLPWDTEPHKVKAVSLPFILAQQADGELCTLDVRCYRFARLPNAFGRKAFEKVRKEEKEKGAETKQVNAEAETKGGE